MRIVIPAVGIPVVVFLLYFLVPGVRERPWDGVRIAGAVMAACGYVLLGTARIQLGSSFSVRPRAKELVTHGLYSRLRNPMYIPVDLMLCGLVLMFEAPRLFIVPACLAVFQTIQARRESAVLEKKFGKAYLDYRRRTWV